MDVQPKVFTGPLSLSLIRLAYNHLIYGYDEPDIIKCNHKLYAEVPALVMHCWVDGEIRFANAIITKDESIPDNELIITFTKVPVHFSHPNSAISIIRILDENPY